MKLLFRPATTHPDDLLDTEHVRKLWDRVGTQYLQALGRVTGLAFGRGTAIVRCGDMDEGHSGVPGKKAIWIFTAKIVRRDGEFKLVRQSNDELLVTLTHELCHRLLAEHYIMLRVSTPRRVYEQHRMIYIFLYDSWVVAFGKKRAQRMAKLESAPKPSDDYQKAWEWAMSLSARKRARITIMLTRLRRFRLESDRWPARATKFEYPWIIPAQKKHKWKFYRKSPNDQL